MAMYPRANYTAGYAPFSAIADYCRYSRMANGGQVSFYSGYSYPGFNRYAYQPRQMGRFFNYGMGMPNYGYSSWMGPGGMGFYLGYGPYWGSNPYGYGNSGGYGNSYNYSPSYGHKPVSHAHETDDADDEETSSANEGGKKESASEPPAQTAPASVAPEAPAAEPAAPTAAATSATVRFGQEPSVVALQKYIDGNENGLARVKIDDDGNKIYLVPAPRFDFSKRAGDRSKFAEELSDCIDNVNMPYFTEIVAALPKGTTLVLGPDKIELAKDAPIEKIYAALEGWDPKTESGKALSTSVPLAIRYFVEAHSGDGITVDKPKMTVSPRNKITFAYDDSLKVPEETAIPKRFIEDAKRLLAAEYSIAVYGKTFDQAKDFTAKNILSAIAAKRSGATVSPSPSLSPEGRGDGSAGTSPSPQVDKSGEAATKSSPVASAPPPPPEPAPAVSAPLVVPSSITAVDPFNGHPKVQVLLARYKDDSRHTVITNAAARMIANRKSDDEIVEILSKIQPRNGVAVPAVLPPAPVVAETEDPFIGHEKVKTFVDKYKSEDGYEIIKGRAVALLDRGRLSDDDIVAVLSRMLTPIEDKKASPPLPLPAARPANVVASKDGKANVKAKPAPAVPVDVVPPPVNVEEDSTAVTAMKSAETKFAALDRHLAVEKIDVRKGAGQDFGLAKFKDAGKLGEYQTTVDGLAREVLQITLPFDPAKLPGNLKGRYEIFINKKKATTEVLASLKEKIGKRLLDLEPKKTTLPPTIDPKPVPKGPSSLGEEEGHSAIPLKAKPVEMRGLGDLALSANPSKKLAAPAPVSPNGDSDTLKFGKFTFKRVDEIRQNINQPDKGAKHPVHEYVVLPNSTKPEDIDKALEKFTEVGLKEEGWVFVEFTENGQTKKMLFETGEKETGMNKGNDERERAEVSIDYSFMYQFLKLPGVDVKKITFYHNHPISSPEADILSEYPISPADVNGHIETLRQLRKWGFRGILETRVVTSWGVYTVKGDGGSPVSPSKDDAFRFSPRDYATEIKRQSGLECRFAHFGGQGDVIEELIKEKLKKKEMEDEAKLDRYNALMQEANDFQRVAASAERLYRHINTELLPYYGQRASELKKLLDKIDVDKLSNGRTALYRHNVNLIVTRLREQLESCEKRLFEFSQAKSDILIGLRVPTRYENDRIGFRRNMPGAGFVVAAKLIMEELRANPFLDRLNECQDVAKLNEIKESTAVLKKLEIPEDRQILQAGERWKAEVRQIRAQRDSFLKYFDDVNSRLASLGFGTT